MDATAIRQIGRYRLIEVIGRGGMGVVYRAIDESIDRQVAIKMLLGGYEGDKDLLARFHREVRSTANLQHKNIVTVYALDDFEGFPYMVMEFLDGQSVAEMISSRRQLNIVEKLQLIGQVCEGLQFAHERNIIHRDIKPANILVLKDGTAKVVDFGIARMGRNETQTLTHTGQIIGSLYYMSPEQLTPPGAVDGRTDIYSTGVTLYQFLTGELPFKSSENDPQGTILKILNDPVPSLSKYLTSVPIGLEEILRTAMAKDASARYQTAEDFGYELSRMQENLKHEMISEFLSQAKAAIAQADFDTARQKLQEILRFEKRNPEATQLFQLVREQRQKQQRSVQVAHLQSQAQIALAGMQHEEAFECIEQARRLDPENQELAAFSIAIKNQIELARELTDALRRGQAALIAGDLDDAGQSVQKALEIDNSHTEARALEGLIRKELEERSRRARLQAFVEQARHEISDRNYLSALHSLKEAQAIDPADSNIRELLNWAQRGHEQEKLRNELHKYIDEVGRQIADNRHAEALASCEEALQHFPNDASLLKMQQLAQRQEEIAEQRRTIEDACGKARRLTDEDKSEEAIKILEEALKLFPEEPILAALLANTRSESERGIRENEERERQLRVLATQSTPPQSAAPQIKTETLNLINLLQMGMSRNVSMSQLSLAAEQLRSAVSRQETTDKEDARVSLLLSDFGLRLTKWKKDIQELEDIRNSIRSAKDLEAVTSLLDRARFLRDLHEQDEEISDRYERIRTTAEQLRNDRDRVNAKCLEFLQSIQGKQNLDELLKHEQQVREASARWMDDPIIGSLVNQTSDYVEEAQKRKAQILDELPKLKSSLATARTAGQIRLLEQQAQMLAADFTDTDVDHSLKELKAAAQEQILQVERMLLHVKELAAGVDKARSIEEIERCQSDATNQLQRDCLSEEAADLLKRAQRQSEERRREYRRIQDNLKQLIASADRAADLAELDLIMARRRDLLNRYTDDLSLRDLEARLERSVTLRREALQQAAVEEAARIEEETFEAPAVGYDRRAQNEAPPISPGQRIGDGVKYRRRFYWGGSALGLAVIGAAILVLLPKSVSITTNPSDAVITVDSEQCSNPCTRRLKLGKHYMVISRPGFAEVRRTIDVGWKGAAVPIITLPALPKAAAKPSVVVPNGESTKTSESQLVIRTSLPGVLVFLDNSASPVGTTDSTGELQLPATARPHRVRVEKDGFERPAVQTVVVRPEGQTFAFFKLTIKTMQKPAEPNHSGAGPEPAKVDNKATPPPPQPQQEAFLIVQAPAGSEIHIDQLLAGHSTGGPLKTKVQPGSRTVEVFLAGYQPYGQVVSVGTGQEGNVVATLTPIPPTSTTSTSANPKPSVGSSAVSDEDRKRIQQLLDRYADGYSQKDIKTIQSSWPSIPADAVKKIKDFFKLSKSVDMRIRLTDAFPAGKRVTVDYSQTLRYSIEGKEATHTESKTLYVIKGERGWVIDFIPTS